MNVRSNRKRSRRAAAAVLSCALLLLPPLAVGYGGDARELTRPRAAALLHNSPQAFDTVIYYALRGVPDLFEHPLFDDEPEERVLARAVEGYFKAEVPAVLKHLGYIDARAVITTRPRAPRDPWRLSVKAFLTERGQAFARRQGGRYDDALPLAKKRVVEVTGIVTQRPHAVVDFTWRAEPNEAGAAFDPRTEVFKALPPELRQRLQAQGAALPREAVGGWERVRQSRATLQLYDDGWRVRGVQ